MAWFWENCFSRKIAGVKDLIPLRTTPIVVLFDTSTRLNVVVCAIKLYRIDHITCIAFANSISYNCVCTTVWWGIKRSISSLQPKTFWFITWDECHTGAAKHISTVEVYDGERHSESTTQTTTSSQENPMLGTLDATFL